MAYFFPLIEDPVLKIVQPSYMTILFVMVWRSVVKFDSKDIASILGAIGNKKFKLKSWTIRKRDVFEKRCGVVCYLGRSAVFERTSTENTLR